MKQMIKKVHCALLCIALLFAMVPASYVSAEEPLVTASANLQNEYFVMTDIRNATFTKVFDGDDGKHAIILFGDFNTCQTTQAVMSALISITQTTDMSNLNIYAFDVFGNSAGTIQSKLANLGETGVICVNSSDASTSYDDLFMTCCLANQNMLFPLLVYKAPGGAIYHTSTSRVSADDIKAVLESGGFSGAGTITPTPTPAVTPTAAPTVAPTVPPAPSTSPVPVITPTPVTPPTPTATPVPGSTATPNVTPGPGATTAPNVTPSPGATTAPNVTPGPGATTAPDVTPSPGATTAPNVTPGPVATPTPTPSPEDIEKVSAFVERMYTYVLGRNADPNGLNDWVGLLLSHERDGAGIAQGFFMSTEFTTSNVSNDEYIKILYRTFFNREADTGGYTTWKNLLDSGASRTVVLAGFVNSDEFSTLCNSFGIVRGTMRDDGTTINPGIRLFVDRLYNKVLGRAGEEAGINDWCRLIADGTYSAEYVAKLFFASAEFIDKNTDNAEYVEILYQTFMGRGSDADGKAFWIKQLSDGMTREAVLEGFSRSNEFGDILRSFGL